MKIATLLMKASTKDIAEFFRLTLHLGLSTHDEIERWADSLIEHQTAPANDWQIELSNAVNHHPTDVLKMLSQVPGRVEAAQVGRMLLGRIAQRLEARSITPEEFLKLSMVLYSDNSQVYELFPGQNRDQFFDIVQASEPIEFGGKTKTELEEMIYVFLRSFREFDFCSA